MALGAWAWDLHVQTIQRNTDAYVTQVLHMMTSAIQYKARDHIIAFVTSTTVLSENSDRTVDQLMDQAWNHPSFRERLWTNYNTSALWMSRIRKQSLEMAEYFDVQVPASFTTIGRFDDAVHALLHPPESKLPGAPEEWTFLNKRRAREIRDLVEAFEESIMFGTNELAMAMSSKKQAARTLHVMIAALGAALVVLGKALGWRQDAAKARTEMAVALATDARPNEQVKQRTLLPPDAGRASRKKRPSETR